MGTGHLAALVLPPHRALLLTRLPPAALPGLPHIPATRLLVPMPPPPRVRPPRAQMASSRPTPPLPLLPPPPPPAILSSRLPASPLLPPAGLQRSPLPLAPASHTDPSRPPHTAPLSAA